MWSPLGLLFVGALAFDLIEATCHIGESYYKELGCRPEGTDKDGCVTSYDCGSIAERSKDKCHYKGKTYSPGQDLEKDPYCMAACRCERSEKANDMHAFTCADIECPDLFNGPPEEGCYYAYDHDHCCYTETICDADAASKSPRATCEYAGKIYKEGQHMDFDEQRCKTCICQSGFNGTLEPFCREIECNLEILKSDKIAEGCVPIYRGPRSCCPSGWRCPDEKDTVIPLSNKNESSLTQPSGKTCKFGSLTMQIGDMLSTKDAKIKCSCQVPPQPFCFRDKKASVTSVHV